MLKEFVDRGSVLVDPDVSKKEELFRLVAGDAHSKELITDADSFFDVLMEREKQMSTEIEPGIALPHARTDIVKESFAYVISSKKGIKFGALGSKVRIAFLVGVPSDSKHYLDVMAMIARLLQKKEFRQALAEGKTPAELKTSIDDFCRPSEGTKSAAKNVHALFLSLNDVASMDTALELAIELGVRSTQVLETVNGTAKLAIKFPFMSMFSPKGEHSASRTLFGIIEDESTAGRLCAHLKQEGIDLSAPGIGLLFTFALESLFGGVDADVF